MLSLSVALKNESRSSFLALRSGFTRYVSLESSSKSLPEWNRCFEADLSLPPKQIPFAGSYSRSSFPVKSSSPCRRCRSVAGNPDSVSRSARVRGLAPPPGYRSARFKIRKLTPLIRFYVGLPAAFTDRHSLCKAVIRGVHRSANHLEPATILHPKRGKVKRKMLPKSAFSYDPKQGLIKVFCTG